MLKIVTVITALVNKFRGIKSLGFGKDDVEIYDQIAPFGFEFVPPEKIKAVVSNTTAGEDKVVLGYLVEKQADLEQGESMIYASDGTNVKTSIITRIDGTIEILSDIDNAVRYSVLKNEYDKTKGVLDAILTTLQTVINEPGNGSPSAFQAAMIAAVGVKQTGDISGSKIEEIKVP